MEKNQLTIVFVLIALMAVVVIGFGIGTDDNEPSNLDEFAQCLTEKGVKMYGTYWCSHCENQKEAFEKSWQYINYVECSESGGGQTQECADAGINGYPTWEFQDGSRLSGELSFEVLSSNSGCPLN